MANTPPIALRCAAPPRPAAPAAPSVHAGDEAVEIVPVVASGDMVGVIGKLPVERRGFLQAWRIEDGKFVESWWPGFVPATALRFN